MPVVKEKVVVVSFLFKPSSLFSFDLHFVAFSSSSCCGGSGAGVEVVVVVADVVLVVVDILEIDTLLYSGRIGGRTTLVHLWVPDRF